MNDIITDIKALQEETLLNLQSSKANNTVRAYRSDFNDFDLFCVKNGFKSIPSEPKIVSLYLTHLSTKNIKMSTLKRRLVSIGVIHKLKGQYLDTKHPSIIENIMGIK
jgi:site-specific recombinase XerD